MDGVNSPARRYVITLAALVVAFIGVNLVLSSIGFRPSSTALMAMTLGFAALVFVVTGRYWRGIDEAAREAQKSAWFWGGSIGGAVAFLGMMSNPFGVVDAIVPASADREALLVYGAVIGMVGQMIGYFLAWAYWWARRR